MKDAFIKLLKVKSLITLIVTIVFAFLAFTGKIEPDKVMEIYLIIIGFYFGTQSNKAETDVANDVAQSSETLEETE